MKEIYLGLDLCKKYIQLSYFREDKKEPESICQLNNTETYLLPNVMFYSTDEKKWYVGNNVSTVRFQGNGTMVEDIMGNMDSLEHLMIEDKDYSYPDLLRILLKTHIEDFLERFEESKLMGITITLESYHKKTYETLFALKKELKIKEKDFHIISHENAFFQYVMNQEERIHTNSVALFEYGTVGMEYYRIDKKHQGNTKIFTIGREDMRQELPYTKLFSDVEQLDKEFAEIARHKMKETYISSVFLTGQGFNDKWIEESTKVLCDGRRVFMGQNIYTKGASYHAKFGAFEQREDCILCTEGSISFDIGVMVGDMEGRNHFYPIAAGGQEWYNMRGRVTLFLDDTNRVHMAYRDRISKDMQKEIIEIHGLPKRPPKTTKIALEVEMFDEKMGAIVIRDLGFGKIYPTTNKIYRKEFSIGN